MLRQIVSVRKLTPALGECRREFGRRCLRIHVPRECAANIFIRLCKLFCSEKLERINLPFAEPHGTRPVLGFIFRCDQKRNFFETITIRSIQIYF